MALDPGTIKQFKDPVVISDCWIDSSYSPLLAQYAVTYASYINAFIIAACGRVNSYCNRYFNKQQVDQVYYNESLTSFSYKTFVLKNRPVVSIDNVWLNIAGTFNEINLDYLIQDVQTGYIKLLPSATISSALITTSELVQGTTDLWVRYTSGYINSDDTPANTYEQKIPEDVKLATAMIAETLLEDSLQTADSAEFRTQTYSQKSFKSSENPKMNRAEEMLKKYKITTFV